MSRIISANKLNRFWKNGIIPIKNNLNNKIKTKADLMANTVEGYVPDALAVKEGLKEINDSLGNFTSEIQRDEVVNITYYKNNHYVMLDGSLTISTELLNNTTIIITPEGYTPKLGRTFLGYNRSTKTVHLFYIRNNGELVTVNDLPTGNYAFSGTYIA